VFGSVFPFSLTKEFNVEKISVIAAIGPLNSRQEANAHAHNGEDVNVDDIQINFSSMVGH
jgi:hypothetical protein